MKVILKVIWWKEDFLIGEKDKNKQKLKWNEKRKSLYWKNKNKERLIYKESNTPQKTELSK